MTRPLRLAVATHCFGQELKAALLLASRSGAGGVQLDARNEAKPSELSATGRRQFAHALAEIGLQLASLDFPLRRPLWDAERLDARIDALKQAMEFAYELKARVVTARLGGLPDESDAAGQSLLKDVLDDLARHGNHVGVTLAIGSGRESPARFLEMLKSVTTGPIGVNFDPAATVMSGTSPSEAFGVLREFVAHVLVRDAIWGADGEGNEVPVGRGEVPWDELLFLLQESDFAGWLTVDRTQGQDRAGDAGRALQYLQTIYRG
jgi:sugar phosphate isomerase/epimerase